MKKMFIFIAFIFATVFINSNAFAIDSIDAKAGSKSSIDNHSINEYNTYDRKFANTGVVQFPQTNGFFTTPTRDSSYRSIKDFVRLFDDDGDFMVLLSEGAIDEMARGGDVISHLQIVRGPNQIKRIYDSNYKCSEKWLWVGIEKPIFVKNEKGELVFYGTEKIAGLNVTGIIDGEADDSNTNSMQVVGKLGQKALKDGNNYMVITDESYHRMVAASGFGVGVYIGGGLTNESGKESLSPGGGTGYSSDRTTPEDKPWIHGYVGVKNDVVIPDCKPLQTGNHTKYGSMQEGH